MLKLVYAPQTIIQIAEDVKQVTTADVDAAIAMINDLWNTPADQLDGFYEVQQAVGTVKRKDRYENLVFPIEGRFEADGHRWLFGGGVAFDIDSEIAEFERVRAAIKKAGK